MKASTLLLMFLAAAPAPLGAQTPAADEQQALRQRIERRYDVVPLTNGLALRPKVPMGDVRLIEISDSIAVNGAPVSGRELAQRVGADADAILKLSYLDAAARRALFFAPPAAEQPARPEAERPVEPEAAPAPAPQTDERRARRVRRSGGERIRIFGDVHVREGEEISGQVVAVIGDVRIDGEVGDQVVAVLGTVELGPHAVVHGDVVTVGGRLRRADGAQVHGAVTEVAIGGPGVWIDADPWFGGWGPFHWWGGFGAATRLIGTLFRLLFLALIASLAIVIARGSVEGAARRVADNPVKATLIGFLAWILFVPMFVLICFVLAVSIIGIPVLVVFIPFTVLMIILMAVAGFTATAYAVGQAMRRRFGGGVVSPLVDVWLGILVILAPVLLARVTAIGGWPLSPVVALLLIAALAVEGIAWASGFGAVLTNSVARWQATRAMSAAPPPASM